jgi:nucleoside-diphosphate-sugar epimerase
MSTCSSPPRSARERRPTLLIVGCGDVGLRVLRQLSGRWRIVALTSSSARRAELRAAGALPLVGDLDRPATIARLGGLADAVLHLAPPPAQGTSDPRTRALLRALARFGRVRRIVYASTSGVYGDCGGDLVVETRALNPSTDRARRRTDAERLVRWFGAAFGVKVTVLRVPGIYAPDRLGGDPRDRIRRAMPALTPEHDVYTNHVHADDLARACVAALMRGPTQRAIHVNDDSMSTLGDYLDRVADLSGLPRVRRITREQAARELPATQMSFLSESRRLDNTRMKRELRLRLRYPTVEDALGGASLALRAVPTRGS